jgi:hypothetical protein
VAGATTKELMTRLGHASPQAALRYQHATAERDTAVAAALDGLATGVRPPARTAEVIPVTPGRDPAENLAASSRPEPLEEEPGETAVGL